MIERVAHLRMTDRDFNVYIGISYETMTLYAYKYDDQTVDFNWFTDLGEFQLWLQQPFVRPKF
jgi:hypothetical protein